MGWATPPTSMSLRHGLMGAGEGTKWPAEGDRAWGSSPTEGKGERPSDEGGRVGLHGTGHHRGGREERGVACRWREGMGK
jgi:hypothetical protein